MTLIVAAALIRRDNQILITQRFNDVDLPGLWEFPGGKVEHGESLQQALKREIFEELGIFIDVGEEFFSVEHQYPDRRVHLHFFNCSILQGEPRIVDVADLRWVSPQHLDQFRFPEADSELIARIRSLR
jgi:mutator protein MutT